MREALTLTNCLYVPGLDSNIFNVWYAANEHQVKFENLPAPRLIFPGGSDLPMMPGSCHPL